MKFETEIDYSQKRVDKLVDDMMRRGMEDLGKDIEKRAIVLAPVLTGALRQSSKVVANSESAIVSFGGQDVPYARRRHFENNLHPETRYYLTNAVKSIGDPAKYFKGKLKGKA